MNNWVFPNKIDSKWGYQLAKDDVVKFGWVWFKVTWINSQKEETIEALETSKWDLC